MRLSTMKNNVFKYALHLRVENRGIEKQKDGPPAMNTTQTMDTINILEPLFEEINQDINYA